MAVTNVKQFNSKIGSIKKSTNTLRENVQQCFDFGLMQYGEHGNSTFMSILQQTVYGGKSMAASQLLNYMQAHANVVMTTAKDKKGNVKVDADGKPLKVFKKREGEEPTITLPTCNWWEFEKEKHIKEVDPDQVIQGALKRIANAIDKGNIKGTKKHAREVLKVVEEAMEAVENGIELEVVKSEAA